MNRLLLCLAVLLLGSLLWSPAAHADVTCQAAVQNGSVNFGSVDPSQSSSVDVTATINYSCSNNANQNQAMTLCFNIGYGSAGAAADGNRQMVGSGTPNLEFQLYQDAARSQIAGSIYEPAIPQPISAQFSVPRQRRGNPGSVSRTVSVYARLFGNQSSPVGSYILSFTPQLTGNFGHVNCNNTYDDGISTLSPFTAVATVPPSCSTVAATDLDFGQNTGLLTANMDQTSTINVTCVNGTPYQVGLDNGLNASGNTRRMFGGSNDYLTYELYQDSAHSQRWGNAVNTDTASGTATGSAQQFTVYGRVPPQVTPSAGSYADTITVYVYY